MIITGIDTETTGTDVDKGHRIVEFSASLYKFDENEQPKHFANYTTLIQPLRAIERGAEAVHGISLDSLRSAPTFDKVAHKIHRILNASDLLVIHNAEFDVLFIHKELERVGMDFPVVNVFCTMMNGRLANAMGNVPNLGDLCFALGVDYDKDAAHSAEYDTNVMMSAFFMGIKKKLFEVDGVKINSSPS